MEKALCSAQWTLGPPAKSSGQTGPRNYPYTVCGDTLKRGLGSESGLLGAPLSYSLKCSLSCDQLVDCVAVSSGTADRSCHSLSMYFQNLPVLDMA